MTAAIEEFKAEALAVADAASDMAKQSGAANVLTFEPDGRILADNTDGFGLLRAFAVQAPAWDAGLAPVAVLGSAGRGESLFDGDVKWDILRGWRCINCWSRRGEYIT